MNLNIVRYVTRWLTTC